MAKLIKCKTCGNGIAKTAKVCPHCGAKNKGGGGGCSVVFVALFVIIVVAFIGAKAREGKDKADAVILQAQQEEAKAEREKLASMTPEQRKEYLKEQKRQQLAGQFADKFERKFDGSIKPVVEYVKSSMNDPDSFKHVQTEWFIRNGADRQYTVRMRYRGTNGFGAVVTETVEVIIDQDGKIIEATKLKQ